MSYQDIMEMMDGACEGVRQDFTRSETGRRAMDQYQQGLDELTQKFKDEWLDFTKGQGMPRENGSLCGCAFCLINREMKSSKRVWDYCA